MAEASNASVVEHAQPGGQVLALFARPLNCLILRALGKHPMRFAGLLKELGGPAQTTLRGRLVDLTVLGVVSRRSTGSPYAVENELTEMGRELLHVTEAFATWLARAPAEPISLGSVAARGAIRALAGAWESTMLCAFAARPLTLTQLNSLIAGLSYPALERRLAAMRTTGLVEPLPNGVGVPYEVSRWGREAVGPLAAAARFEQRHMREQGAAPQPIDMEAAFLLAAPIARLPAHAAGACQFAAQADRGSMAGVSIAVDRGQVVGCLARLEPNPRSWAIGDERAWLDALVIRDQAGLRVGGDIEFARSLVLGVHDALFS